MQGFGFWEYGSHHLAASFSSYAIYKQSQKNALSGHLVFLFVFNGFTYQEKLVFSRWRGAEHIPKVCCGKEAFALHGYYGLHVACKLLRVFYLLIEMLQILHHRVMYLWLESIQWYPEAPMPQTDIWMKHMKFTQSTSSSSRDLISSSIKGF